MTAPPLNPLQKIQNRRWTCKAPHNSRSTFPFPKDRPLMIYGNDRLIFSVLLLLEEISSLFSFSWPEWEVVFKTRSSGEGTCHSGLVVVVEHLVLLPHNKMRQQYQEKMNYYHYKFHEAPWGIAKGRKDTSDLKHDFFFTVYVERIFNLSQRFPKENVFSTLTSRLILIGWCVRMHYASCRHVMGSGRTGHVIQRWLDSPVTCTFGWKENGWMDLSCWRHLNKQDSYCVQMFVFAVSTHFLITCGLGKLSSAFQPTNKVNAANY